MLLETSPWCRVSAKLVCTSQKLGILLKVSRACQRFDSAAKQTQISLLGPLVKLVFQKTLAFFLQCPKRENGSRLSVLSVGFASLWTAFGSCMTATPPLQKTPSHRTHNHGTHKGENFSSPLGLGESGSSEYRRSLSSSCLIDCPCISDIRC